MLPAIGLLAATPAAAVDISVPGFYSVATEAAGVQLVSVQNPPLGPVTNQFVQDTVGYAASSLDSGGGSSAAAATFYPGELAAQAGSLICTQFIPSGQPVQCPTTPPPYPLLADAQYPTNEQDTASANGQQVGGDSVPLLITPGIAEATAHERDNSSHTTVASGSLLTGTPAALSIGAVTSATSTTVDGKGVHVHVETTVHDITLPGRLHIDVLHAVDQLLVPEGGKPVGAPQVTIGGVTVAGHAATIDEKGVHIEGQAAPSLLQNIAQQGMDVRFGGIDKTLALGTARTAAYGLQVQFDRPINGIPYQCLASPTVPLPDPLPNQVPCPPDANRQYTVTLNLGAVGAAVIAQPGDNLSFPDFSGGLPTPGSFGVGAPSFTPPGAGGTLPSVAGATGTAGTTGARPQVAARPQRGVALLTDDLSTLYLALAGGAAALFLGWRAATVLMSTRRHA